MPGRESVRLLGETKRVLSEARQLGSAVAGNDGGDGASATAVLELYERLCRALEDVDGERLKALLGRISRNIEELNGLDADLEAVRRLHRALRKG